MALLAPSSAACKLSCRFTMSLEDSLKSGKSILLMSFRISDALGISMLGSWIRLTVVETCSFVVSINLVVPSSAWEHLS